jgi:hypothetical protein
MPAKRTGFKAPGGFPAPALPKQAKQPAMTKQAPLPKALSLAAAKAPIAKVTMVRLPKAPRAPKAPVFASGPMKGLGKR